LWQLVNLLNVIEQYVYCATRALYTAYIHADYFFLEKCNLIGFYYTTVKYHKSTVLLVFLEMTGEIAENQRSRTNTGM